MREWIQTGVSVVSVLLVAAIALFLVANMRAMQTAQLKMIEAMQSFENRAKTPSGESLEIRIHRGRLDGPPAPDVEIQLVGKVNAQEDATVDVKTGADGIARFDTLPQGNYRIFLEDPLSKMSLIVRHSLFAGVGATMELIAPDIAPVPASFRLDSELPFPNDTVLMLVRLSAIYDIGELKWSWNDSVFIGNRGMYAQLCHGDCERRSCDRNNNWEHQLKLLGGPIPTIEAPPGNLRIVSIRPVIHDAGGGVGMLADDGDIADGEAWETAISPDSENNVAIAAGDKHIALARKLLMNFTAQKWIPERNMEFDPLLNGYVVDAIPLTGAEGVQYESAGEGMAKLTVLERSRANNPRGEVFSPSEWTSIPVENIAELAGKYPAGCRFVLTVSADAESAQAFPWNSTGYSGEIGAAYTVAFDAALPLVKTDQLFSLDIGAFIRGRIPAASHAGLLIQTTPKTQGVTAPILLDLPKQETDVSAPYLIVLQDTPPETI